MGLNQFSASMLIDGHVDANADGSGLILCIKICIAVDALLNFDGDANADVKCERDVMGEQG